MLAIFRKKIPVKISAIALSGQLCLALDEIQDPGNLDTIIRIADWFGIKHIFCSTATAVAFDTTHGLPQFGQIASLETERTDQGFPLKLGTSIAYPDSFQGIG